MWWTNMQGNLINNYIQPKTSYTSQSANVAKTNDGIEIVTRRKAKPNFDINRELANRTFIKPLPPSRNCNSQYILESSIFLWVDSLFMLSIIYSLSLLLSLARIKPSGLFNNSLASSCVVLI